MDSSQIIVGFLVSTVGFSFFLYGKKQARMPHLLAGILLMVLPFAARDPLWMGGLALAALLGLRVAARMMPD